MMTEDTKHGSYTSISTIIAELEAESTTQGGATLASSHGSDISGGDTLADGGAEAGQEAATPLEESTEAEGLHGAGEGNVEATDAGVSDTADEPVPPAEPRTTLLDSERWAELDRLSRQVHDKDTEVSTLQSRYTDAEAKLRAIEELSVDPVNALKTLGIDYNDLLDKAIADPGTNKAHKEISELRQQLQEVKQQQLHLQDLQVARNTLHQGRERWAALVANPNAEKALVTEFYAEYNKTGSQPSLESLADRMNKALTERLEFESWKKTRGTGNSTTPMKEAAVAVQPKQDKPRERPQTLTNQASEASSDAGDVWELLSKRLGRKPTSYEVMDYLVKSS